MLGRLPRNHRHDIYPSFMWAYAYRSALNEAIYQNLGITGIEINP